MVFSEGETTLLEAPPSGPEEELLRDVVSLRYAGELKFGQIALALGKTASSVRMIHHRALRAMRAIYLRNSPLEFTCANV